MCPWLYAFKHVTGPSVIEIEDAIILLPDKVPETGSLISYPVLSTIVIVLVQGTWYQESGALVSLAEPLSQAKQLTRNSFNKGWYLMKRTGVNDTVSK